MASKYFQAIDPFVTFYGQAGMGSSFGATNNARYSNMVMWQSNNYSGFTAGVGYSFNTGNTGAYVTPNGVVVTDGTNNYSTTNNQRAITLGVNYASGPLTVTATYDQVMPQDVGADNASTPKQWIIGGSYDFQVVKASLAYGQTRGGWIAGTQPMNGSGLNPSWTNGAVVYSEGIAANSYLVGLSAPINAQSKVFASYQAANPTGNFSGVGAAQSIYSLGYDYSFSKRTTAYAAVSYANNYMMIDGAKSTVLMTGVRHQF
jgi:predicted porin